MAARIRVSHSQFTQKSLQTATIGRNQNASLSERDGKRGRKGCTYQIRGVDVPMPSEIAMTDLPLTIVEGFLFPLSAPVLRGSSFKAALFALQFTRRLVPV